jgi:hypothetical protein
MKERLVAFLDDLDQTLRPYANGEVLNLRCPYGGSAGDHRLSLRIDADA